MNASMLFTGIVFYLLLMLKVTLTTEMSDDEKHELAEHASLLSLNKINPTHRNEEFMSDDMDEHEFEKRRFNAWAGKRSYLAKRRFNAWAGRR